MEKFPSHPLERPEKTPTPELPQVVKEYLRQLYESQNQWSKIKNAEKDYWNAKKEGDRSLEDIGDRLAEEYDKLWAIEEKIRKMRDAYPQLRIVDQYLALKKYYEMIRRQPEPESPRGIDELITVQIFFEDELRRLKRQLPEEVVKILDSEVL